MKNKISEIARQGIIDKLIYIGQIPGKSTYRAFFQRVYPKASEIERNKDSLINEIGRHCDSFPGDWGDDTGMFEEVDILHWSDQEFLHFCLEYVNPVFNRSIWNEEQGVWVSLQQDCVDAINCYLRDCGFELRPSKRIGDKTEFSLVELTGVKGEINCILFASTGKPEILLTDVLNQTVRIPVNENRYLLYDRKISSSGLSWKDLCTWYNERHQISSLDFLQRLRSSVTNCKSPIEEIFFNCYLDIVSELGDDIPALLPQVYLYYDSKAQKERTIKIFDHQCMDFLMLFSGSRRVVFELDGVQHYSDDAIRFSDEQYSRHIASPQKYAQMVRAQREMTLAGYEVYRFGGSEFQDQNRAKNLVKQFFMDLFQRHGVVIPKANAF